MLSHAILAALLAPFLVEAVSVSFSAATAFQAPSEIVTSSNVLTLTKKTIRQGIQCP
jgi:hypothetical protein